MTEEEKTPEAGQDIGEEKDPGEMTEKELRARLEKHFREQKVDEVLVQFLVSLSNLAYIKMGLTEDTEDVKDLSQASLAIDAFKALLDTTGGRMADQEASALAGALSSMQMTFAKVSAPVQSAPTQSAPAPEESVPARSEPAPEPAPEPGPGKSGDDPASRLWVPGKD